MPTKRTAAMADPVSGVTGMTEVRLTARPVLPPSALGLALGSQAGGRRVGGHIVPRIRGTNLGIMRSPYDT